MHYKNGREAKVGDKVVANSWQGLFTGIVVEIQPGSKTCNAVVVPLPTPNAQTVTLGECLHAEDGLAKEVFHKPE